MRVIIIFDFPEIHTESISASRIIRTIELDCAKILELDNGEACWIDQIIEDEAEYLPITRRN
jgi:hypothetical protein